MSWRNSSRIRKKNKIDGFSQGRIKILAVFFIVFCFFIVARIFDLQILRGNFYTALASGQHELYQKLFPERGSIYVVERSGDEKELFPLVTNQNLFMLYAVPKDIENSEETAEKIFEIFGLPPEIKIEDFEEDLFADISEDIEPAMAEEIKELRRQKWYDEQKELEIEKLTEIFSKENDPYEPVRHRLTDEQVQQVEDLAIEGLAFKEEVWRFYPEQDIGGQLLGFWGFSGDSRAGSYGLEGYFDEELSGSFGEIRSERDAWGNIIAVGNHSLTEKVDGSDIVLTIDRAIQYKACQVIKAAVERYKAEKGSVIVMNPKTGAVIAMCGAPDFDPDKYNDVEDIKVYSNTAIFDAYEPGSIFKPITMAAALDMGKVDPYTTYVDNGSERIDVYNIKNFDNKVYGRQTMTEVLEKSINTGVIFAMRQITPKVFASYVKDFGFGQLTGIKLNTEMPGNIANLDKAGEIYAATASFGQGITVTPLQMVSSISAIANGGKLMKPYIVSQIINSDGTTDNFYPQEVRQVISQKSATMLSGMLVSVVESGHASSAAVPGYRVAGKTGTAQVASQTGRGYSGDVITSFVGFAPFSDPKFVALVRIDKPEWGRLGALSAAPVFGDIAKFILQYYNVPYDSEK